MWGDRYRAHTGYVLGFHGCDRKVKEKILKGKAHLKSSEKEYDWLGSGMYFWEGSPQRALEWAKWHQTLPDSKIKDPCVIGAVIDLGLCCNLFDRSSLDELAEAYEIMTAAGIKIRENTNPAGFNSADLVLRFRDRQVIEWMHDTRKASTYPEYDTVRSAFAEGDPLYTGAGFRQKNHIQIAVRTHSSIKAYFRPIKEDMR